jgi:hypothetical protein
MARPSWRVPMIMTHTGISTGQTTPATTARAMTPQAWATSSGPFQIERD